MFTKIYEKFKKEIQENYLFYTFIFVLVATLTYKLPYYIDVSGGIIDINKKVIVENDNSINGSYNICYVEQLQATLLTYAYSFLNKDWDVIKQEDYAYTAKETSKDIDKRDKIYLDSSNQNAILTAFKYANKEYKIISSNQIVISVLDEANTDIIIGDEILEVEGIKISTSKELTSVI